MRFRQLTAVLALALSGCYGHAYDDFVWRRAASVDAALVRVHDNRAPCSAGEAACARWRVCDIYVPAHNAALTGHEAAHCLGYEHE